jgi:ribosomal protein S30
MGKGEHSILHLRCALVQYSFYLVHGSLARAGKVKSQTPKVEKQEKKKTPKGRAKKRMLYNRAGEYSSALNRIGR